MEAAVYFAADDGASLLKAEEKELRRLSRSWPIVAKISRGLKGPTARPSVLKYMGGL